MTVEQLIVALSELDPEAEVFTYNVGDFETEPIVAVEEAQEGEVIIKF